MSFAFSSFSEQGTYALLHFFLFPISTIYFKAFAQHQKKSIYTAIYFKLKQSVLFIQAPISELTTQVSVFSFNRDIKNCLKVL